jgi:prepilin-type N-terminal cleavage/methylation domain-containing protein
LSQRERSGVTLIELVVVIAIAGILAYASSAYIKQVVDLWGILSFSTETVTQGKDAVYRMVREIREVKNDTCVYAANTGEFKFLNTTGSSIDFYLANNTLMRNSDILAKNMNNLAFTYYNETSAVISAPLISPYETDIRRIVIAVGVRDGQLSKNITEQVVPRNLAN